MKDIANYIKDNTPKYNEYLLRGFMAEQIDRAADFVDVMFGEAVKLFCGLITYKRYEVFTPERRAEYELNTQKGCRITTSDLALIDYIFEYDKREYSIPLYIPYLRNDVITIKDTIYVLQRSVKEQTFSRNKKGVTIKVIRQPIRFYNNKPFRLESLTDTWSQNELVATTIIYQVKRTNKRKFPDETIILYLLCKFGLVATMTRVGLTTEDFAFVTDILGDTEEYRYFAAKYSKKKHGATLFLKIRKEKLKEYRVSRFAASLLYIFTHQAFQKHQVEDLYDPTGQAFRAMLGRILHGTSFNELQCKKKVDTHIASLDTYLDPITKNRLQSYDIDVNDIYDLLFYVFLEIDKLVQVSHTDLYTTRIDYIEELLVETIIKWVYLKWYEVVKRLVGNRGEIDPKKLNDVEVKKILRIKDSLISNLGTSRVVQMNPPVYGDNILVGWLIQKMRLSGLSQSGRMINSPDHQFHPSQVAVESILSFSKSSPGAAGSINPYLEIKPNGSVIRPDFADEIDELKKYLP